MENININININNDQSEMLNDSWIEEYEVSELNYSSFYKEKIETIKLNYIYVDDTNHVSCLNQESLFIVDGKLDKEQIIDIIKNNRKKNNINYKLISILKSNITLEPEQIKTYIDDDEYNEDFLSKVDILQDIYFKDTIHLFQDLNGLYFIFCDKNLPRNDKKNITKKIMLRISHKHKNKNTRKNK